MITDWYQQLLQLPALLSEGERRNRGGDSLLAALAQYRETDRLPADELAEQQRALLGMLAEHAVAQSPQFARRLANAGLSPADLSKPGGLQRLPPMSRRELVDAGEALFCRQVPPAHGRVASTSTSGSTGEPVTIRRTELNELHWSAATLREHLWHGRDFSQRLAIIRANKTARGEFASWGAPADRILRTGPALVLPGTEAVGRLTDELEQFRPGYLLVLPSVLGGILDELAQRGGRLDGLREVRTLSETVPARLRERTREILGVPIRDVYSSQEGGVMATQCPEVGTYHAFEMVLLEVVDSAGRACQPGEVGRVLVTDLLNFATPLIRYEIGDYAEAGAPCSCGRGMFPIARFLGRERNLVLMPDGSRHWPVVGFHRWGAIHPVRQFQFIQVSRTAIEARFSAESVPAAADEARLIAAIQEQLGYPFEIRCEWTTARLPVGPGGKFEEFVRRPEVV